MLRSDIATAYYRLSEAKQNVLRIKFSTSEETEWKDLAEELKTTEDGARMKVQRAISSLIKNLGGYKPYHDEDVVMIEEDDDDTSAES